MTAVDPGVQFADGVDGIPADQPGRHTVSRRSMLGLLIAAPTLMAAAKASASITSPPEPSDLLDLGDLQDLGAATTSNLIAVVINADGTVSFAMPRCEVGQGISTAVGMLIAEELEVELSVIKVTLADARIELNDNQLTGGSNTIRSLYNPVRTAAALAREQLLLTAAGQMNVSQSSLVAKNGVITAPDGRTLTYGSLAHAAAVTTTRVAAPKLKSSSNFTMVGTPQNRVDAMDIVMGKKQFVSDIDIPGAMPVMLCRPPTIGGGVSKVNNLDAVKAMPGVLGVVAIPTVPPFAGYLPTQVALQLSTLQSSHQGAVAVRARTFGQCIDAIRALDVTWTPGKEDATTEDSLLTDLGNHELPFLSPTALKLPVTASPLGTTIDRTFDFMFASNSPLETGTTIADVTSDAATIWSCLKVPVDAQAKIAAGLGFVSPTQVVVHVIPGGGSFGRHLFFDSAYEAAQASKAFGAPVKLMWARTDDFRQGRVHPMARSHVQATYSGTNVVTFQQRHTSVETDFSHGFGGAVDDQIANVPVGGVEGLSQTIFEFTANVPYNYGSTSQLLNESDGNFLTGSLRNIYSPDVCTAIELVTDELAAAMKMDPYTFRKSFLKDKRSTDVLDAVAKAGNWGRAMPPGTAQGIAFHSEYKGVSACLVELDCTPATVNRKIRDAVTGPRVTKVVFAVDVGLVINPRGLEAQMQGGIMDGIAHALTCSLHFDKGFFAEGSWDNYFYTRQWNVPPEIQVIIMPTTTGNPGGAGEFGVAATKAAVACAYTRATGTMPTQFPVNHKDPLGFSVLPTVPPVPQSPTDGLTSYS